MAYSADGTFIFANYFPGGNVMGEFATNVLPLGSSQQSRTQGARCPSAPNWGFNPALRSPQTPTPAAVRSPSTPTPAANRRIVLTTPSPVLLGGQVANAKDIGTAWTATKGQRVRFNFMGQSLLG